jgi:hypothetical protein
MKRNWTTEELIEDWTLLPNELALLENKTGTTRLGYFAPGVANVGFGPSRSR